MDGGGVPRGLSELGSTDEDEERVSWGLSSPPMSDDDADVDDFDEVVGGVAQVDANNDVGDDGEPPPPPPPDESDGGADDASNGPGATDHLHEDDDSVVFVKVVARAPERPKPVRRARATADFRWSPEKEAQRPQRLSKRRPRSPTTPSRRKRRSAPQNDTPGPSPPPDAVAT